jgi:hypothetical protein
MRYDWQYRKKVLIASALEEDEQGAVRDLQLQSRTRLRMEES